MWSSILSSSEAAKERLTSALKETNEALSSAASQHAQQIKQSQSNGPTVSPSPSGETAEGQKTEDGSTQTNSTNAFALFGGIKLPTEQSTPSNMFPNLSQQTELIDNFKTGWVNVVEVTKNVVESTRDAVEKEQTRIHALMKKGPYTRDLKSPLDSESLRDAEVVYLTDRLITMSHPAMQSPNDGDITSDRKLAAIGHLLQKRHNGKYMVWNLSEVDYQYSILMDQVMTYQFPGSPSPPLGLLLKILMSIESWLKADDENVAVLHCLTGKGRSSTVMAAFLCWMGEAGFEDDPNKALEYIAHCKRISPEALTIPSQRRYVSYFRNMMDGVRPSQPPILLKRIIMSEAPKFGKNIPKRDNDDGESNGATSSPAEGNEIGCSPYLQIFKAGKLVFTTAASKSYNQSKDDLPFCTSTEGSITFPVETIVQGDVLIRCRHLTRKGQRVSMFRAAFHTGYTPPKVLRLSKAQLDGACNDKRFADDFFIDLIFEECTAAMASKHLISTPEKGSDGGGSRVKFSQDKSNENVQNEAAARRMGGTIAGAESSDTDSVTASAYDSMLHRDSRFWDLISERREANRKISSGDGIDIAESSAASFYGPTIGRRREFPHEMQSEKSSVSESYQSNDVASHHSMQSFSIGGELDFRIDGEEKVDQEDESEYSLKEAKKDDLMEALMAIDDDLEAETTDQLEDDDDDDDDAVDVIDLDGNDVKEDFDQTVVENQLDDNTEEIVFQATQDEQNEENEKAKVEKTDTTTEEESATSQEKLESDNMNDDIEVSSNKSKVSSSDASLVQVDKLSEEENLEDSDKFDFDDEDDEELQDLQDFLLKAK